MITSSFLSEGKRKFIAHTEEVRKYSGQLAERFLSRIKDGFINLLVKNEPERIKR